MKDKNIFEKIIAAFNFTILGGFSAICYIIIAVCAVITGLSVISFIFRLIF